MAMRVVCPQNVKKMLLEHAKMALWKEWAAKHECEEFKERVWLEPVQAMLRRKTNESVDRQGPQCDEEVGRGRRMGAEKTVRHWLVGLKEVSRARKSYRLYHCPTWREVRGFRKWEQRAKTPWKI